MVPSRVTVLAYHRVEAPGSDELAPTVIDAYPAEFEAQMRHVASQYNVVSSRAVVESLVDGRALPEQAMVITFDDGYRSFVDNAMPVLRRLDLPATLFVATQLADKPDSLFWWDALYQAIMRTRLESLDVPGVGVLPLRSVGQRQSTYKLLVALLERARWSRAEMAIRKITEACAVEPRAARSLLNWEEIQALAAEGVDIGPHSRSHPVLSHVTPDRLHNEITGSWCDLRAHIADPLPIFCYPTGKPHAVNGAARRAVQEAGLVGAYTMVPGENTIGRTDPFLLRRVGMVAGQSMLHFRIRIGASGRFYRRLKVLASRRARAELRF